MTRRDYVLLSGALQRGHAMTISPECHMSPQFIRGYLYAALVLANALAVENPAFDRERFLSDAGAGELT